MEYCYMIGIDYERLTIEELEWRIQALYSATGDIIHARHDPEALFYGFSMDTLEKEIRIASFWRKHQIMRNARHMYKTIQDPSWRFFSLVSEDAHR